MRKDSSVLPLYVSATSGKADMFHQLTHEHLKSVRWSNLRNLPKDQLITISAVDCLDLISQTQPGQERLKKLHIKLTHYVLMLFFGRLIAPNP